MVYKVFAKIAIVVLFTAIYPSVAAESPMPAAKVTLLVFDSYGMPVDYKVETFRDLTSGLDLARQFKGKVLEKVLLLQTYRLRILPQPPERRYMTIERTIKVNNDHMIVSLVAESGAVPSMIGPTPRTRFVIRPSPVVDDQLTWVSICSAFGPGPAFMSDEPQTAVVERDGSFSLFGFHGGRYVMTIFRLGTIVKLVPVDIPLLGPSTPLEVRIN